MRNALLIFFILLGIFISNESLANASSDSQTNDVRTKIYLLGSLNERFLKSLSFSSVQATISSTSLDALFLSNLGTISVIVYTESGSVVYDEDIDTSSQSTLSIDVNDWDSENYQIYFMNTSGRYMYGDFEIK